MIFLLINHRGSFIIPRHDGSCIQTMATCK